MTPPPPAAPTTRCLRYDHAGTRCTNETDNADGWCRQRGCGGYLRNSTEIAPESEGKFKGTKSHIAAAASPRTTSVDFDEVRVAQRAIDSFLFHHGGDRDVATSEILTMVEDFAQRASPRETSGGYLSLVRDGYEIVLSPDKVVVTAYSTVHRERTWSQVKAGVRSRFNGKSNKPLARPAPETGPPVVVEDPAEALTLIDTAEVFISGSAFGRAASLMGDAGLDTSGEGTIETWVRDRMSEDLAASPTVSTDERGVYLVESPTTLWVFRPDLRLLIGLVPRTSTPGGPGAQE